jgi:hypothetical protein
MGFANSGLSTLFRHESKLTGSWLLGNGAYLAISRQCPLLMVGLVFPGRVERWRGDFRREHIRFRRFRSIPNGASLSAQAAIAQAIPRASAARACGNPGVELLPLLRFRKAVQTRRGHYRAALAGRDQTSIAALGVIPRRCKVIQTVRERSPAAHARRSLSRQRRSM